MCGIQTQCFVLIKENKNNRSKYISNKMLYIYIFAGSSDWQTWCTQGCPANNFVTNYLTHWVANPLQTLFAVHNFINFVETLILKWTLGNK